MGTMRLQSAMEYLMTYAWAIFIIAAAVVTISYLFFSGNASSLLSPKATPGSCSVQIAYQNGNLGFSRSTRNLIGQCNNELPEYASQFNGKNSIIPILRYSAINYEPVTYSMWIKPENCKFVLSVFCNANIFTYTQDPNIGLNINTVAEPNGIIMSQFISNFGIPTNSFAVSGPSVPSSSFNGRWYYVASTYNGNTLDLYIDGNLVATGNYIMNSQLVDNGITIGGLLVNNVIFINQYNGSLVNVQLYNVSLSSSDIRQLYSEGIGGEPIALQNLAGWWPLNGNAKDYSGVGSNGNAINVNYTTLWTSGYSQPPNVTS